MPSWLPTVIFVPLVGFALYRRYRRSFGPQRIEPSRMWVRMGLLVLVSILSLAAAPTGNMIAAAIVGAIAGAALGVVGLKQTQYATMSSGRTYTTKPWVGLAVTALFLGRLAARLFTVYSMPGNSLAAAQRSPLTTGIFFVMTMYYVVFYLGVMRESRT